MQIQKLIHIVNEHIHPFRFYRLHSVGAEYVWGNKRNIGEVSVYLITLSSVQSVENHQEQQQ